MTSLDAMLAYNYFLDKESYSYEFFTLLMGLCALSFLLIFLTLLIMKLIESKLKSIVFTINNTGIQFDRNYGIDKRTGWTVIKDGSVILQFEKYLIVALLKCFTH